MAVCTTCLQPGIKGEHDCPGLGDIQLTRTLGRGLIVETAPPRARMAVELLANGAYGLTMQGPEHINIADQVCYRVVGYDPGSAALVLELVEDWRPKAQAQEVEPGRVIPVEGNPAAVAEAIRQMDDDPHGLKAGMIVQSYREYGQEKWVFRCWGTDDGCDGLLSLDHGSQSGAERARDRHVAEEHADQPKEA